MSVHRNFSLMIWTAITAACFLYFHLYNATLCISKTHQKLSHVLDIKHTGMPLSPAHPTHIALWWRHVIIMLYTAHMRRHGHGQVLGYIHAYICVCTLRHARSLGAIAKKRVPHRLQKPVKNYPRQKSALIPGLSVIGSIDLPSETDRFCCVNW
mgnify:CR=1 FL=1